MSLLHALDVLRSVNAIQRWGKIVSRRNPGLEMVSGRASLFWTRSGARDESLKNPHFEAVLVANNDIGCINCVLGPWPSAREIELVLQLAAFGTF